MCLRPVNNLLILKKKHVLNDLNSFFDFFKKNHVSNQLVTLVARRLNLRQLGYLLSPRAYSHTILISYYLHRTIIELG